MTKFNNNYVPSTPKTYEVKYVDLKEPSKISQIASYLGVKTAECCSSCGNNKQFRLAIDLRNMLGNHLTKTVYNTDQAESEAQDILKGKGSWKGSLKTGAFHKSNRKDLSDRVTTAVNEHKDDKDIIMTVTNDTGDSDSD